MRAAWTIALREVRGKARLFVICAALALVPFAAALLADERVKAAMVIAVVGGFLATIFGLSIATTLGVSTVTRDLAERRMSFYFTKPVGATALWTGKALASLFISLACTAIIAAPSFLASRKEWVVHWLGEVQPLAALAGAIVVAFFLAHLLASVVRSRSPLLALDFLFLVVALASVYLMIVPLIEGGAVDLLRRILIALAVAVLAVLAIAPVWQLANGRSDIRRSHAALMRFLWPAIAIVLLIAGGVVAWVVHVSPEDIDVWSVEQPRRGTQVLMMGTAQRRMDYHAAFLIDSATGSFRRIPGPLWWRGGFSGDGRVAAWFQDFELHTTQGPTGIPFRSFGGFMLSGDGTRVTIEDGGDRLAVYDIATAGILAAMALDDRPRYHYFFVTPDLVRVLEYEYRIGAATPLRVFELDVRARQARKIGERVIELARNPISVSADGSRMFLGGVNEIVDGRTAQTIAKLDVAKVTHSAMLHDGRVALIAFSGGPHLRIFERDGTPRHVVPFTNERNVWIAGETENGKLILAAHGKTMYVVDLASGAVERKLPGVRGPLPRWSSDPRLMRYAADQELVGIDANGKLILWSARRASVRPLLQSR